MISEGKKIMANSDIITAYVDVNDLRKLAKKLDIEDAFKDGLFAAATYIKGVISEYPPATAANLPQPYPARWYERGFGTKYKTKDGTIKGNKTSEILGKRWTVKKLDNGNDAEVGNNASYAPFVQDKTRQAKKHKQTGWPTVQQVAEEEGPHAT
jgi:hypothetical protein